MMRADARMPIGPELMRWRLCCRMALIFLGLGGMALWQYFFGNDPAVDYLRGPGFEGRI